MRITTGARYGLRVMLDVAQHQDNGPVLRQDIAYRQGIPTEYVAQLFRHLVKAGLVHSIRGPGGGYLLGKSASNIRVSDIFRSVEGSFAAVSCVQQNQELTCNRMNTCATHVLWTNLSRVIENYLDSVSLSDLSIIASQLSNTTLQESPMMDLDWLPCNEDFSRNCHDPIIGP